MLQTGRMACSYAGVMSFHLFESAGIRAHPTRQHWDASVIELLQLMIERWSLTPEQPYTGGFGATVLRVRREDGSPAVLKLGFPHPEAAGEALGLAAWPKGTGPELFAQDAWRWALLLERIEPGDSMLQIPLETVGGYHQALMAACRLLRSIWSAGPVPGVPRLSAIVTAWAETASARLPTRRAELQEIGVSDLVHDSVEDLFRLSSIEVSDSLVHGDYNPGNILRSGDGWRVIDPKPMVGDPSYDLWPLVGQLGDPFRHGDAADRLTVSLQLAAAEAGCDVVRAARWAAARSALNVTWYLEERDRARASVDAAELKVWAEVRSRLA